MMTNFAKRTWNKLFKREDHIEANHLPTISIVIVGMEHSKFAGSCPGAERDAANMATLLRAYSPNIRVILNGVATIHTVTNALKDAVKSDLAIFYYSGHGGSERFSDTGSEEVDGKDEFLCLYDGYLRDNDLWKITSKANGRVFEMFDCCHSNTMFKSPGFTARNLPSCLPRGFEQNGLLVWSGCPDDSFSYGSSDGGQMTNALIRHFSKNKSYTEIWSELLKDQTLKRYEAIQRTVIGTFPEKNKIFN